MAKKIILSFTVGICLMLVVLLAIFAKTHSAHQIDVAVAKFLSKLTNAGVIGFLKIFTYIGSVYCLTIISLSLLFLKNKTYGVVALIILALSGLTGVAIKYIIKRPRPEVTHLQEIGYSFPSAHAMLSLLILGFVIYIVFKLIKNKAIKISLSCVLGVTILIVSLSRIMLGVHYFTDVLAGWCVAIPFLILAVSLCEYYLKHPLKINKKVM